MEQIGLRLESVSDRDRIGGLPGSTIRRQVLAEIAAAIVVVAQSRDDGAIAVAQSNHKVVSGEETGRASGNEER